MPDTTIKFRRVTQGEMTEFEQSEWKFAKETVDWYFIPKLMEYDHFRNWYIPNILNWHTPHVMDGGIELQASVAECQVQSNEDAGWVSAPSDLIEFVLGKDSFVGMMERYSTASVNRDSDKLYHLYIVPEEKKVVVEEATDQGDEFMRQWLLKHNMLGVRYEYKLSKDLKPLIVLRRFQKESYTVSVEDGTIDEPIQVDMIKVTLGLNKHE